MLTPNQIKNSLINYFNSIEQVTQVLHDDEFEFNANRELNYGFVVNLEKSDPFEQTKFMYYPYVITIADLYNQNYPEMKDDIQNDALLIAKDFVRWVKNVENGILGNLISNVTYNYFTDSNDDRIAGVVFNVSIPVALSGCIDSIPFKED